MSIVDSSSFETVKHDQSAGGGLNIFGLLELKADASWSDFKERRAAYAATHQLSITMEQAADLERQIVPDEARRLFVQCMGEQHGLKAYFSEDGPEGAVLQLQFVGDPGAIVSPIIDIQNGTTKARYFRFWSSQQTSWSDDDFVNGGQKGLFIIRTNHSQPIIATINLPHGTGSATAYSLPPASLPHPEIASTQSLGPSRDLTTTSQRAEASRNSAGAEAVRLETGTWASSDGPPQWIEYTWARPITVSEIKATTDQLPSPAPTWHMVFATLSDNRVLLVTEFHSVTSSGQLLEYTLQTPIANVVRVRILTIQSPSWVSWQKFEVWGFQP